MSALTVDDLEALPVGSVIVDPFDTKGDAPVVACKNSWGFWMLLGDQHERAWRSAEVAASSKSGLLRAVYIPATPPQEGNTTDE